MGIYIYMTFSAKASKHKFFKCTWNILQDKSLDARPQNVSINLRRLKSYWASFPTKTLMKEIENDTKIWKYILCSWIRKINTIKMTKYPRQWTDSMQPLSKYQWHFHRTRTYTSKVYIEPQRPQIAKTILRKKTKAGDTNSLVSSHICEVIVIETAWYWPKNRHINQWNKIAQK